MKGKIRSVVYSITEEYIKEFLPKTHVKISQIVDNPNQNT